MGNATEELEKYYQKHPKAEKPKYIDKWIRDQEEAKRKGKHTAKRRIIAAINKLKIRDFAYPKDNKLHIEPEDPPKPNTMRQTHQGIRRQIYAERDEVWGQDLDRIMQEPEFMTKQDSSEEEEEEPVISDKPDRRTTRSIRLTKRQ